MIFSASRNNGFFWGGEGNIMLYKFHWRRLQRKKQAQAGGSNQECIANQLGWKIDWDSILCILLCIQLSTYFSPGCLKCSHCADTWYSKGSGAVENPCQSGTCKPTVKKKKDRTYLKDDKEKEGLDLSCRRINALQLSFTLSSLDTSLFVIVLQMHRWIAHN